MDPRSAVLAPAIALAACAASRLSPPVTVDLTALPAQDHAPSPPAAPSAAPGEQGPPEPPIAPADIEPGVAGGIVMGVAPAAPSIAPLRAHRPTAGRDPWRCHFPPEAIKEGVDEAAAVVQVFVDARGKVARTVLLSDPGHGFGREAQACVARHGFGAAEDDHGNAVPGSTVVKVRFDRPGP